MTKSLFVHDEPLRFASVSPVPVRCEGWTWTRPQRGADGAGSLEHAHRSVPFPAQVMSSPRPNRDTLIAATGRAQQVVTPRDPAALIATLGPVL